MKLNCINRMMHEVNMGKQLRNWVLMGLFCALCLGAGAWAHRNVASLSAWLMGGRWHHVTVRSGDTLLSIFKRHHWSRTAIYQMMQLKPVHIALKALKPGQQLSVLARKSAILALHIPVNATETWVIMREADHFTARRHTQDDQTVFKHQQFTIAHTLYGSAHTAHVPATLVAQLVQTLQDRIDFDHSVHSGDTVALAYQTPQSIAQGDARLLDATFCHQSRCHRSIRFTDDQGVTGYYTPKGFSVQPAFDRTPLDHFRISSSFSKSRWHPIFHRWHAHSGVDLAAPMGTAVHSTGAGRVVYSGAQGGYGRVVILQHGARYRTVYAHLSKIASVALRSGRHVARGQVIGYVGQTGIATGPHCHYEFRINGEAVNPMRVHLPKRHRLVGQQRVQFQKMVKRLDARMTV